MAFDLKNIVRPNIWALKPYSCARDEFKGEASVYLDANENPYNAPFNRYPDPLQWAVKEKLAQVKGVAKENILLGNGSDEPIDLVYRAFIDITAGVNIAVDSALFEFSQKLSAEVCLKKALAARERNTAV